MATELDEHGQPLNPAFNARRRAERDIAEMLGVVKGILSDGVIRDDEVAYLKGWADSHAYARTRWPVSLVFNRLVEMLADGRIDDAERADLHALMNDLVGGATSILLGYDGTTLLPLDEPAPLICWGPDEVYVFTGKFAYGTREHCQREVQQRGASCEGNVTRRTTFLVLGTFGSRDWRQTSYGRKIERAVHLRESGFPIRIVGEDHWAGALSKS